jgi:C1A family cysteine protease
MDAGVRILEKGKIYIIYIYWIFIVFTYFFKIVCRVSYTGRGMKYPTVTNEYGMVQTNIHFLVIVGYGTKWMHNELVTYYNVRNSTGIEWSDNGYGRIETKEDLFSCFLRSQKLQ